MGSGVTVLLTAMWALGVVITVAVAALLAELGSAVCEETLAVLVSAVPAGRDGEACRVMVPVRVSPGWSGPADVQVTTSPVSEQFTPGGMLADANASPLG